MGKPEVKFGNVAAKKIVIYPSVHGKGSYISNQYVAGTTTPQEFAPSCDRVWLLLSLQRRCVAGVGRIISPRYRYRFAEHSPRS